MTGYWDPDWLEEHYEEKDMTQAEIADLCGVSTNTIHRHLRKHDLTMTEYDYRDPDWLEEQYYDHGKTQREIAEMCGVAASTIQQQMAKHDIETRGGREKRRTRRVIRGVNLVDEDPNDPNAYFRDPDWQYNQHWVLGHSINRMLEDIPLGRTALVNSMDDNNVPRRDHEDTLRLQHSEDPDQTLVEIRADYYHENDNSDDYYSFDDTTTELTWSDVLEGGD